MMIQNLPKPKILLVSDGRLYVSARLAPVFREAGWEIDLLCLPTDLLVHSRYIRTSIREKNLDAIFARLQEILLAPLTPWQSVIVADERIVRRLIGAHNPALLRNWQPGAVDPQTQEFLFSKFGLVAAGRDWQLPVPSSQICRTLSEVMDFGNDAGWPIISKPPMGGGGRGVVRFNSAQDLASDSSTLSLPVLAQKYIHGRLGVVDMLCSSGRVLAWLSSYSTKRMNGEFSPSTARLFQAMPGLQPLVEQIARLTKFEGFCGFDWIEEETSGKYYLLEFHPRPSPGYRFGRFCGVDFAKAVSCWLRQERTSAARTQSPGKTVQASYFSHDLIRCFRQRDWQGLKTWLPFSQACHDIYWDDPLLIAVGCYRRLNRWIKTRISSRDTL